MSSELILLDRDGVINEDQPGQYVTSVDQWKPIAGSIEAMVALAKAGKTLVVVSNQSGLARGLLTLEDLFAMHAKLNALLNAQGVGPLPFFFCPHHPQAGCHCRKPNVGLAEQIEARLSMPANQGWMVGDKMTDIEFAKNIGARPAMVLSGHGSDEKDQLPESVPAFTSLYDFSQAILNGVI